MRSYIKYQSLASVCLFNVPVTVGCKGIVYQESRAPLRHLRSHTANDLKFHAFQLCYFSTTKLKIATVVDR